MSEFRRPPPVTYARSSDGVIIAATAVGDGPALVFLPAVPFSNFQMEWRIPAVHDAYARLAGRVRIIQYDGRGTGLSQRHVDDVSMEAMIRDLQAVVDHFSLASFGLFGFYLSCPFALGFAARHPDRVTRVALFGGTARGWHSMASRESQALLALADHDWDVFADAAASRWTGWEAGAAGRMTAESFRSASSPHAFRAIIDAASGVDVTHLLPKVTAETLVLFRSSLEGLEEPSRELAEALPRGRFHPLGGVSRALLLDDGIQIAELLGDYFVDGRLPASNFAEGLSRSDQVRGLTPREREILELLTTGQSNKQLAYRLGLSEHTIERHLGSIYRKLDVAGRVEAISLVLRGRPGS